MADALLKVLFPRFYGLFIMGYKKRIREGKRSNMYM
jgi:hypothetical protein